MEACNNADVQIGGLGSSSAGGYTMVISTALSSTQVINSSGGTYVIKVQSSPVAMVSGQTSGGYQMNVGAAFR